MVIEKLSEVATIGSPQKSVHRKPNPNKWCVLVVVFFANKGFIHIGLASPFSPAPNTDISGNSHKTWVCCRLGKSLGWAQIHLFWSQPCISVQWANTSLPCLSGVEAPLVTCPSCSPGKSVFSAGEYPHSWRVLPPCCWCHHSSCCDILLESWGGDLVLGASSYGWQWCQLLCCSFLWADGGHTQQWPLIGPMPALHHPSTWWASLAVTGVGGCSNWLLGYRIGDKLVPGCHFMDDWLCQVFHGFCQH